MNDFYFLGMWLSFGFGLFLLAMAVYAIVQGGMPYRGALILSLSSFAIAWYSRKQAKS
ncbi:hypothetical protein [Nibricoccus aquaticus]|uniref:hypothetical protein n=1 Tax=Nibricoccus aquaticus TaxID=2576891 RepID=UPI001586EB69|nr:hypothetical protein [Nibricoccus aquaticus]